MVNNWQVYWTYGEIVLNFELKTIDPNNTELVLENELSPEGAEKAFNLFFKAFRNLYNQPNWELSLDTCKEILTVSNNLLSSKK